MVRQQKQPIKMEYLNSRFGYFYAVSKTLYTGNTAFQKIEMLQTPEFGVTLVLDGITQVVEKNDYQYHEPMVHPAICCHPRPEYVLIIGGGDGGILREVVKYKSVKQIDFAEIDEGVIRFSKKYLRPVHRGSFDDPRVRIHISDGRTFVENNPGVYDVIIMDMTDPFGPAKYLYTKEFFTLVKRAFRDRQGIFCMHTESPITRPATFSCIIKTLSSVFGYVQPLYQYIQMYAVLWSISMCSDSPHVARRPGSLIDRRLRLCGIRGLKLCTGRTFEAMKVAYLFVEEILARKSRVLTDKRPNIPDTVISR